VWLVFLAPGNRKPRTGVRVKSRQGGALSLRGDGVYLWCHQILNRVAIYQIRPRATIKLGVDETSADPASGAAIVAETSQIAPDQNSRADSRVWALSFLLVPCVVVSGAPAARASRAPTIGAPQFGQAPALRETACPQSGHGARAGRLAGWGDAVGFAVGLRASRRSARACV
jgi:hypothetical protein